MLTKPVSMIFLTMMIVIASLRTRIVFRGILHDTALSGTESSFNLLFQDSMEECSNRELSFEGGTIPHWLQGALIRNGPACFGSSARRFTHIFDGLAKLTKFAFKGHDRVTFSTTFLRSDWYRQIVVQDNFPPSITTGPVEPPFSFMENVVALATAASKFDNVPVNIHRIGGSGPLVAVTDAPVAIAFDPLDLATHGRIKYTSSITSSPIGQELFSTAHPKYDKNGQTINYFLELDPLQGNKAHIVRTDASLTRTVVGSVSTGPIGIPYVHDISVTDNYAVLCIWPIQVNPASLVNGKGFLPQLEWLPDEQPDTKIYVFDLNAPSASAAAVAGPVAEYTAPPMFAYHHINAFESSTTGDLVFDVSGYLSAGIVNGEHAFAYIHNVCDPEKRKLQESEAKWYRYSLPLRSRRGGAVEPLELEAIDAAGQKYTSELVTINPNFERRENRYSYGFTGFGGNTANGLRGGYMEWALVKLDHAAALKAPQSVSATVWREVECYTSEPIMVPRPGAIDEDDGVLLSQVFDGKRRETFLLVLDAATMKEVGRSYVGMACPLGFHGKWIS